MGEEKALARLYLLKELKKITKIPVTIGGVPAKSRIWHTSRTQPACLCSSMRMCHTAEGSPSGPGQCSQQNSPPVVQNHHPDDRLRNPRWCSLFWDVSHISSNLLPLLCVPHLRSEAQ